MYKGAGGGLVAPPSTMYENTEIHQLQEMINKSIRAREINDILVTQDMAKNIVQLHEALNNDNKKILEENIQTKDGFFRTLDFSVRN
jgi:dynactin complex subunit